MVAEIRPAARQRPSADPRTRLRAEAGDTLVIDAAGQAGLPRVGTIVAVSGPDGSPPYLVRWVTGDYESTIIPGPGSHVEKHW